MCGAGLRVRCWGGGVGGEVRGGVGRLARHHRTLRLPALGWWLGAGLVAVAVNAVALIWKLARTGFLTLRVQSQVGAWIKSASARTYDF